MKNILFSYKSIIYYYIYDGVSELINVIYNIQYFRLWCSHPFIYIYIYIVIHNSYIIKENDKNLEIIVQSSIPKKAQRCERKMIRKFRS